MSHVWQYVSFQFPTYQLMCSFPLYKSHYMSHSNLWVSIDVYFFLPSVCVQVFGCHMSKLVIICQKYAPMLHKNYCKEILEAYIQESKKHFVLGRQATYIFVSKCDPSAVASQVKRPCPLTLKKRGVSIDGHVHNIYRLHQVHKSFLNYFVF